MEGLHPDLIKVLVRFIEITPIDATVTSGLRTPEEQARLFQSGASQTLNSRHLTGHAVDVIPYVNGKGVTEDWDQFHLLAAAMKQAAEDVGVSIMWGGDWESFKDGWHWQLPWAEYPKDW